MKNFLLLVTVAFPLPVCEAVERMLASLVDRRRMVTSLRALSMLEMAEGKGSNTAGVRLFQASKSPCSIWNLVVKKKLFFL